MTRFLDGPAVDVVLMLRRAPPYLRAVQTAKGDWDALDLLTDQPEAGERIVVYRMTSGPFTTHVNRGRGRGRKGGGCSWYVGGEYALVAPQPADADVRTTEAWRAWASAQLETDRAAAEARAARGGRAAAAHG